MKSTAVLGPPALEMLPADWWGTVWERGRPRSLGELIQDGMLRADEAGYLAARVARGESMTIAASVGRAGKSTLLAALLPYIPAEREARFVRGRWDFESVRGAADPAWTTFLVNEISPHLPVYAWTPVLGPLLAAIAGGGQLLTTMHAASMREIKAMLAAAHLGLEHSAPASLGCVVFLDGEDRKPGGLGKVRSIKRAHGATRHIP
jgi:hypothetical protein